MEALGIDYKLFLAQVINFIAFFFLFKKFISKPFFDYMRKIKLQEEEKVKILAQLERNKEKLNEQEREIIKEAQEKAVKIIKESKNQVAKEREEVIKKAHNEAEGIRAKATKSLEAERIKLYDEAKSHTTHIAAEIAKSAMREFINESSQKEIIKNILTKYKDKKIHDN